MVLLCLIWGVGNVAAKIAGHGISFVFQAGLRSVGATILLLLWVYFRKIPLWERDRTLWPGIFAGLLFAAEFVFIFAGFGMTDAARMAVFVYMAPCITAFGLHFLIPQERLSTRQWAGILLAFLGVAVAFGDGFLSGRGTLMGDFFGLLGAALWAATTIVIRSTRLASVSAPKTLFYQLAVSGPVLLAASWMLGETGIIQLTPIVLAAFAYQCIVISFISYLTWFWLLRQYIVSQLGVLTFLTPLFGVLAGVLLLREPITASFAVAAVLVGAGIYLVNLKKT